MTLIQQQKKERWDADPPAAEVDISVLTTADAAAE